MRRIVTAFYLLLLASMAPVVAQTAPPVAPNGVAGQLALIQESLEGIRQLLRQDVESRELDLLFRRSEFASDRKGAVEEQLRSARGELRGVEEHQVALLSSHEALNRQIESGDLEVDDQSRVYIDQMESQLKRVEDRLRELQAEVGRLEGELMTRDLELQEWQDLLDRMLPKP